MEIVSLIGKCVFDIFGFKVSELVASATSPHAGIASQRYLNNVRYQNIFYYATHRCILNCPLYPSLGDRELVKEFEL